MKTANATLLSFGLVFAVGCAGGKAGDQLNQPDLVKVPKDMAGVDGATVDNPDMTQPANDGKTTLNVHYPLGSHTVSVRGDHGGLNWDSGVATTKQSDELVSYTLELSDGETLEWKPLLDDKSWSHGANYKAHKGQTVDIYPHFVNTAGYIDKPSALKGFAGDNLNSRDVIVYLPPSYSENTTAHYPVLYMHDGANLFDPKTAFGGNEWKVDETMDGAVEGQGTIREVIVVGIYASGDRNTELTPTFDSSEGFGGKGDDYLKMVVQKLKPKIDSMYRTLPARETTGIMGSSLGGLISVYAGLRYPDVFGIVGAMSPSTWWDGTYIIGETNKMDMTKTHPLRVYIDSGSPNDDTDDTKNLADAWQAKGYTAGVDFDYVVKAGEHSEIYWAQRLPDALAFLFGPQQ